MARAPHPSARRSVVLRAARPDTRSTVRASRNPRPAPRHRRGSRSQAPVRAAPAAARARGRDVPRGGPAAGHPATARSCRPRDHHGLSPRDRQHRDHPHRPRTTRTHDPCHQPNHTPPLSPRHEKTRREAAARRGLTRRYRAQIPEVPAKGTGEGNQPNATTPTSPLRSSRSGGARPPARYRIRPENNFRQPCFL